MELIERQRTTSVMTLSYIPPTEQTYSCHVPARYYGFPLSGYFAERFDYLSEDDWTLRIRAGMITVNGAGIAPDYVLQPHDRIVTRMGLFAEPPANRALRVIYENEHVRVFNKSAPIPVHPCGRYYKNSMTELFKEVYPGETLRPVQRLDCTTTGVIVFAKTRPAAAFLTKEFMQNRIDKEYLALVDGAPRERTLVIDAPIGKVKNGPRAIAGRVLNPKSAVTEAHWLSTVGGRSLLRVVPRSGRTNQIRVHLAGIGLPVHNDRVYGAERKVGHGPIDYADGPLEFGLHAYRLAFRLPGHALDLTAPWPEHFQPFIDAAPEFAAGQNR
jgi:23S rRNA pseudouridine1911/1915/1917 synthase